MSDLTYRYRIGVGAVLLASMLSSVGWILEGQAVARLAPVPIACVCHLLGGLILIVWGSFVGDAAERGVPRAVLKPRFIAYSVLRNAVVSLLFATSLSMSSSVKVMFLTKIEPYVVLLLQVFLYGHRTTPTHLLLLAIHLVGAVALSTGGSPSFSTDTMGDIVLFVAVCANATLYAPSQRYARELGVLRASGFSQLLGGLALTPFTILWYSGMFTGNSENLIGWGYALATVLVFYVLSTALWFLSLREIPAWLVSALRCIGPVIAAPIAWIVFNQPLNGVQIIGASVVVATSMWMVVLEKRS